MNYYRLILTSILAVAAGYSQNTWTPAGTMVLGRAKHTFTALADGRALATGGNATIFTAGTAATEIYSPISNSWTPAAPMSTSRSSHTATRLADGRVLVVGGCASSAPCTTPLTSAEIYNPAANSWSPAGTLTQGRNQHSATLLADGRVLVAGGQSICNSSVCTTLSSTEIYNPANNSWAPGASLPQNRIGHTATLLSTGKVLFAGGCPSSGLPCTTLSSVLYDPSANSFGGNATLSTPRTYQTAQTLANGNVFIVGGVDNGGFTQKTTEIYNVAANTWTPAANSLFNHFQHFSATLPSGDVLASGSGSATELYLAASNSWVQVGSLAAYRESALAAVLSGGQTIVSGGLDENLNGIAPAESFTQGPSPLISITPASLDFGYVALLKPSEPKQFVIRNVGGSNLVVSSFSESGDTNDFKVTSQCPAPLPPNGTCTFTVVFRPFVPKERSAVISIVDNAPNSPHGVPVAGYGYIGLPNFWTPAGTMKQPRYSHTLTTLPDGRVLAAGGGFTPSTAELYDGTDWNLVPPMNAGRSGHAAALLADGRVLVAGGAPNASAEIYNPSTNSWTATGVMTTRRALFTLTRLTSGLVLAAGGCVTSGPCVSTEIFDPSTNLWTPGPNMQTARTAHTATLLNSGRVLMAGGAAGQTAEAYDPGSGSFVAAGTMLRRRLFHTASKLNNGSVLAAGGCDGDSCTAAEVYSPATNSWTNTGVMTTPRVSHQMTPLPDGRLLAIGGIYFCESEFGFCFATRTVDAYNPTTGRWTVQPILLEPRANFASTVLPSGQVLVSGGKDDLSDPKATAEKLTPQ